MPRIVRRQQNDDERRPAAYRLSWGRKKSTRRPFFVDLVEKQCSGEVKLDGSGVPVVSIDSPEQPSGRSGLDIIIMKRSLNQVACCCCVILEAANESPQLQSARPPLSTTPLNLVPMVRISGNLSWHQICNFRSRSASRYICKVASASSTRHRERRADLRADGLGDEHFLQPLALRVSIVRRASAEADEDRPHGA